MGRTVIEKTIFSVFVRKVRKYKVWVEMKMLIGQKGRKKGGTFFENVQHRKGVR